MILSSLSVAEPEADPSAVSLYRHTLERDFDCLRAFSAASSRRFALLCLCRCRVITLEHKNGKEHSTLSPSLSSWSSTGCCESWKSSAGRMEYRHGVGPSAFSSCIIYRAGPALLACDRGDCPFERSADLALPLDAAFHLPSLSLDSGGVLSRTVEEGVERPACETERGPARHGPEQGGAAEQDGRSRELHAGEDQRVAPALSGAGQECKGRERRGGGGGGGRLTAPITAPMVA